MRGLSRPGFWPAPPSPNLLCWGHGCLEKSRLHIPELCWFGIGPIIVVLGRGVDDESSVTTYLHFSL